MSRNSSFAFSRRATAADQVDFEAVSSEVVKMRFITFEQCLVAAVQHARYRFQHAKLSVTKAIIVVVILVAVFAFETQGH